MKKTKTFLAIYIGSPKSKALKQWNKMTPEMQNKKTAQGISAWTKWAQKNSKRIIDMGCPIGKTLQTTSKGVSKTVNMITGYTIIEAPSHEAAAKLFKNHPHFKIFPGDSVEIMECLPLPSM